MAPLRRPVVLLVAAAAALFPYAGSLPAAPAAPASAPVDGGPAANPAGDGPAADPASVPAGDGPAGPTKTVAYHGVSVEVPADWPVVDLDRDPTACVRLDREAVYLGEPGEQQDCPAHAVGRAETVWLRDTDSAPAEQPLVRPQATRVGALAARVDTQPLAQTTRAELPTEDVDVQATWSDTSTDGKGLVEDVLDSAEPTTAEDTTAAPNPDFHTVSPLALTTTKESLATTMSSTMVRGSVQTGMGFDTCAAPSLSTMKAWLKSPYRSLGIYIGGSMRACGDGNLSADWVRQVTGMGWGLLPIYVGLQAPCVQQPGLGTLSGDRTTAASQGRASAVDAIRQARRFGFGTGTPIYYDMEMYASGSPGTDCSRAVAAFMSGWSAEMDRQGYRGGAYGGNSSLMRDLVANVGRAGFTAPDDVWSADWNWLQNTDTTWIPDDYWARHQRVHQYRGDFSETWGGRRISIDANWVDGHVAGRARPVSYGTRTLGPGSSRFVFTGRMLFWRPNAGAGVKGMAYWTHPSSDGKEYNGATWSPRLASGSYRVQVYVPGSYANAKVRYTVRHADGRTSKVVDQAQVGGWVSLGTFRDRAGAPLSVHASDNASTATERYIGIDAARFRTVASAPGRPGGVSASAGNARATVRWSPADPNGSTVRSYTVTASPGGRQVTVDGSRTRATVTKLRNWRGYTFTVAATNAAGTGAASAPSGKVVPTNRGHLTPVTPVRIVDTRKGTAVNPRATALRAGKSMTVKVAGVPGSSVPASANAVALNVTAVGPRRGGGLYVGNAGDGPSSVFFRRGQTVAHGVVTKLRGDGTLTVTNHSRGRVHVLLDVRAHSRPTSRGNVQPVRNTRVLDTRSGTTSNPRSTALGAHRAMRVRVAGVSGSPVPAGAKAVLLNLTATRSTRGGSLEVSDDADGTSVLNFRRGRTLANFVLSKVASDGTIRVENHSSGRVHVLASVQGYVTGGGTGPGWLPVTRARVVDAHTETTANPSTGFVPAGGRVTFTVTGASGTRVPAAARAVAMNLTVVRPTRGGHLNFVTPAGQSPSVLNFRAGQTTSNNAVAPVSKDGTVTLVNRSRAAVRLSLDTGGYTR